MKKHYIPVKVITFGNIPVEAETLEEAFDIADSKMFWAYQGGNPTELKDVEWYNTEIEVDGEELDLDAYREQ